MADNDDASMSLGADRASLNGPGAMTPFGAVSLASLAAVAPAAAATEAGSDAASLQTVVVTAQRARIDSLTQKILDTPQSINVVSGRLLAEQGGATLADALKNVPGITFNAGEGGTHGDLVNLRGFSAGDDYFMDGLRDTGLYDRDAFDYESVEVYKGPASTLFGRGSTGGVINQVMKTPQLTPILAVTATAGTNSEVRATADIGEPLGGQAAVRLNVMGQRNLVAGRPFVENRRWGVAPAFAFGLDSDTSGSLKYLHQQEDNLPDYGVPFLFDQPAPVARDTFYGLPADDKFATRVDVVTGRVGHTFGGGWSVSDTARYGHYYFLSRQTAAIYGTGNCFPGEATPGYFTGAPVCDPDVSGQIPVTANNPWFPRAGTPVSSVYVLRDRPSGSGIIETVMNDLSLSGTLHSGPFTHALVAGFEYDNESADLVRFVNQDTVIPPVPLLAPDPFQPFPGTQTTVNQRPSTQTDTVGAYVTDTVSLGTQWQLTAALRYDDFHAVFDQPVGRATHFEHTDAIWSPRAALVYKPGSGSSLYFSYGTSFNPSAENLALSASNAALPPEKDRTFELGAKLQLNQDRLALTAALFDTEMTNARITDPLNPTLQALAGTEHVKGGEVNLQGYLTRRWEIVGGYTYLDAHAVGLAAPGVEGPIPNTARHQANLWTTWDLTSSLKLGLGVNYIGRRMAGTDTLLVPGTISLPTVAGYVTWDALIAWRVNSHLSLRLNGYNLTDRYYFMNSYFTRPNENHAVPGPGRTALLSLAVSL